MKWKYAILVIPFLVLGNALLADDYVDDTYYWNGTTHVTQRRQPQPKQQPVQQPVQVVFLDDSITRQNPDTIVRAIIRR